MNKSSNIVMPCKPNTVPIQAADFLTQIPAHWQALGAERGYNPKSAEDLRLWVVGPSGEGKTTFISSIPNSIILDFDDGASGVPGGRATRVYIQNYDQYMKVTDKLIEEGKANKKHWGRVTFDTVDEWAGMIANQLQGEKGCECIQDYGTKGKGWALIKDRCWSRLRALESAGYVWSCAGHMQTKQETRPGGAERTVLRDSIFPMFSKQITTRSEFKLTIYSKAVVHIPKIKKSVAGRTIEMDGPEEITQKYFLSSLSTEEQQNKQRGAPGMERKFEIPREGAWDLFSKKYSEAVSRAKKQYKS